MPRYPKQKQVAYVIATLNSTIPMDQPLQTGWRRSLNNIPNVRLSTCTNGLDWNVDVYALDYVVVTVGSRLSEPCTSIPSMVKYLCKMLRTPIKITSI